MAVKFPSISGPGEDLATTYALLLKIGAVTPALASGLTLGSVNALTVAVVDAAGNQIVSFGGGGGGGAVTIADGADVAEGSKADAAWVAGDGTVISLLKKIASAGGSAVSIADGSDVVEGTLADAAVVTDAAGTISGKMRGLVKWAFERMPASLGQKVMASSFPVTLASDQSALSVTGTFWQVTQPVSLATLPALVAGAANIGDVDVLTLPSIPAGGNNIGDVDVLTLPAITIAAAQTLATVTTVGAVTAITNALPAGTNRIGSVRVVDSADADQTSVKGTQTARFLGVQRSVDAGRNARIFMLDTITAAPLVEAVSSVVQWYGNAAVGATTQPAVVPAGKTLRLTTWKIQYQSLATVGYAVVRVRVNTAGLGVLGSPLAFSFESGSGSGATTAAMTGGVTTQTGNFPEGFEIPAAAGLAFSVAGYGPTGTLTLEGGVRFMVAGYEY